MAPNRERFPWTVQESALPALPVGSEVELELLALLRHLPGRRAVWHAQHEGKDLPLKAYDVRPKQARDANREWTMAVKLANAGLKVAKPLFNARHPDGRLGVAFTFLPNGEAHTPA